MKLVKKLLYFIKNSRLRTKMLLGYVTIAIFTIIVLSIIIYNYSLNAFTEQAKSKSREVMKQIKNNIEYNLNEMDLLVNYIYSRKIGNYSPFIDIFTDLKSDVPASLLHTDWEFNKLFDDIIYFRDDCNGIFIHGDNGIDFTKFLYVPIGNYDINSAWYEAVLKSYGQTVIFGTHRQFYSENGTYVISVAKRIIDPVYNVGLGIILLDFDIDTVKKICRDIDFGEGSNVMVCDRENNIVYHTDEKLLMEKVTPLISDEVNGKVSGETEVELDGEASLVMYETLDIADWKIISTIPMTTITRQSATIRNIIFLTGGMLIAMIFILSYLLSGLITKPILKLNQQVAKIENEDYTLPWKYESKDEVGQLSAGLESMVRRIKELIQNEYKAKLAENESELKALQAQINPHFIYNTLEIVSTMALVKDVPEIDRIAISLARMLRYSIKTKGNIVPLRSEIQHIEDYITIYNNRFEHPIEVVKDIDDSLLDCGILKLTLQPLIENAIVHGIESSGKEGTIILSGEEKDGTLYIKVADNGVGMSKEKIEEIRDVFSRDMQEVSWETDMCESIGLKNVNTRLFLYYGKQYGLEIKSEKNTGTCIKIKIPAIHKEAEDDQSIDC